MKEYATYTIEEVTDRLQITQDTKKETGSGRNGEGARKSRGRSDRRSGLPYEELEVTLCPMPFAISQLGFYEGLRFQRRVRRRNSNPTSSDTFDRPR